MTKLLSLSICLLLSVFNPAFAGSDPASLSSVNGYFLGFPNGAYISLQNKPGYVRELKDVCRRHGRVWALDVGTSFTCVRAQAAEPGAVDGNIQLTLKSDRRVKAPRHALLFSTHPFAEPAWKVREATPEEIEALRHTATLKRGKYRAAARLRSLLRTSVIEPSNGKLVMFLIPWRLRSDGSVDDKDFLLALRLPEGRFTFRELRGTVVGLADLNGDGMPELQISQRCDGACESVTSVVGTPVSLGIFVH